MTEHPTSHPEQMKPLVGKDLNTVRDVKNKYIETLTEAGKFGSGTSRISGIGIVPFGTGDERTFGIAVRLREELPPEEMKTLDRTVDGVPITYRVTGQVEKKAGTVFTSPK